MRTGVRWVVVGAIALAGCAPPGSRLQMPREVSTRDVLSRVAARVDTVRTVSASGRMSIVQDGTRFDAKHRLLFQRPERFRIEVESKPFLGLFEAQAVLVADGDSFSVYSPTHDVVLEVSVAEDQDLLGGLKWVVLAGVRDVLLGLPRTCGVSSLQRTVRAGKDGKYEILLDTGAGTRILWVDSRSLLVEKVELRDDAGDLIVAGTYRYGSDDRLGPKRVEVQCPGSGAVITLTYEQFEVNLEVDPSDFELVVPADVRR
ncbi:MAG: hypothetical protein KAW17_05160 [Candidatus Eisenbacteria sp.]|nr:hypothetical protein [Candidatus Eisenbacteria bacterium]